MMFRCFNIDLKKIGVIVFLTFITLFAASQTPSSYKITIKNNSWKDTVAYLGYYHGKFQYAKDTAYFDKKGQLVFENKKAPLDPGVYFIVLPDKRHFDIVVNQEQIFTFEIDTADLVNKTKITGSKENSLFYDYNKKISSLSKRLDANKMLENSTDASNLASIEGIKKENARITEEMVQLKKDFIKNHPNTLVAEIFRISEDPPLVENKILEDGRVDTLYAYWNFKNNYWANFDFTNDALVRTPVFHNKLERYFTSVVIQHPDTIIKEIDILISKTNPKSEMFKYFVWFLTYHYETSQIMGFDAVFVHLVDKFYATGKTFWVGEASRMRIVERANKLKPILIGKVAPNMALMTTDESNYIPLHSLKAKYTILLFWDPDCGHCKREMDKINAFYKESKLEYDLTVYSVCVDTNLVRWKNTIEEKNINSWVNVNATRSALGHYQELYDVFSTPLIYLLDENKKIVAKKISSDALISLIPTYDKFIKNEQ